MVLYKKLAYVGSIWSLIQYLSLLIISITSWIYFEDIFTVIKHVQVQEVFMMTSLFSSAFLFGITGTIISIIGIISIKKIKENNSVRKKLSIILIVSGITLLGLHTGQYMFMTEFIDTIITSSSTYIGGYDQSLRPDFTDSLNILFILVPSIILIISGFLAIRFTKNES